MAFMSSRRGQVLALGLALIGIVILTGFGGARLLSEPSSPKSLEPAEVDLVRQLIQRYQRVHAQASVTGDVSKYPSVFYNDPAFDLAEYTPGCFPLVEDENTETQEILTEIAPDQVGGQPGMLSCMIAEMVSYHRNVSAWAAEVARAEAEERAPSPGNLDGGVTPMEAARHADADAVASWEGPRHIIEAVYLDASHIRFAYAEAPLEETPEVIFNFLITSVNGDWSISAMWNSFPAFD